MPADLSLEDYFLVSGFADLLPLALKMAQRDGYGQKEVIEAICKVADKAKTYPPTRNRVAWFAAVFGEKLLEARAEMKAYERKILS
ncbi:MAG: hypothetical protein H5T92_04055 [Synergistales bacterium]|nr:hypothetical protein [Synergistales bacterium]